MKSKAKFTQDNDAPRQVEAAKTNRLRALRLAKEAADKEEAARAAAAQPAKPARVRSAR
jgi:hypothetical protein